MKYHCVHFKIYSNNFQDVLVKFIKKKQCENYEIDIFDMKPKYWKSVSTFEMNDL